MTISVSCKSHSVPYSFENQCKTQYSSNELELLVKEQTIYTDITLAGVSDNTPNLRYYIRLVDPVTDPFTTSTSK